MASPLRVAILFVLSFTVQGSTTVRISNSLSDVDNLMRLNRLHQQQALQKNQSYQPHNQHQSYQPHSQQQSYQQQSYQPQLVTNSNSSQLKLKTQGEPKAFAATKPAVGCVEEVGTATETVYDEHILCDLSYETRCTKVNVTMFEAVTEEECTHESKECYIDYSKDPPQEECVLIERVCTSTTRLVPRTEETDHCVDVPKEVCSRSKENPQRIQKKVIKKTCYNPGLECKSGWPKFKCNATSTTTMSTASSTEESTTTFTISTTGELTTMSTISTTGQLTTASTTSISGESTTTSITSTNGESNTISTTSTSGELTTISTTFTTGESPTSTTFTTGESTMTSTTSDTGESTTSLAPSTSSSPADSNQILWTDSTDGRVKLVDLTGESDVCFLPNYPASRGPVTLAFSDLGYLLACGAGTNNREKTDCFSFSGEEWTPLPPLNEVYAEYDAYFTRSFLMEGLGVWVSGGNHSNSRRMVNELFTPDGRWTILSLDHPYMDSYGIMSYPNPCSVPLNSTHIFFSGGYNRGAFLNETWILDLENLVWTPSTPMLTPKYKHGCTLTAAGEVLVAGRWDAEYSVQIFNPATAEWHEISNLPSEIETYTPALLRWQDKILLLERGTDLIWELTDQGWQRLNVTMGAGFDGRSDNTLIVPDTWRAWCT